jgi:hypothetical protein
MTVLIAMPSYNPSTPPIRDSIPTTTSSTSSSLPKHGHTDIYPLLYESRPDEVELPLLELATVSVPIAIRKDEERTWAGLTEGARRNRKTDNSAEASEGIRIVRTDGFGPR